MPRLVTLGGLTVENGSVRAVGGTPRRRFAILAVLAVAGDRGIRREKLMAMFWPESDEESARNALSQALFALRRYLGSNDIVIGTSELRLNPDAVAADVMEFDEAMRVGRFADAVQLYSGPFLDGFFLREAPDFERWVEEQRHRLAEEYGRALERLAASATEHGDPTTAASLWKRRVAQDPLSSTLARRYMEALVAAGDREAAIRHAAGHAALVRNELGVEPNASVLELGDRIRRDLDASSGPAFVDSELVKHLETVPSPARQSELGPDSRQAETLSGDSPTAFIASDVRRRRWGPALPVAMAAAAILLVSLVFWRISIANEADFGNEGQLLSKPIVLVAPVENLSGDTSLNVFGRVAASLISQSILRSGIVGVVDADNVMQAPVDGGQRTSTETSTMISRLVRRTGSRAVILTSFRTQGDSIEFFARITDARLSRVLSVLDPVRIPISDRSTRFSEIGSRLTGALATLIDSRIATLHHDGTAPPRFDAYEEYVKGLDFFSGRYSPRFDYPSAIVHFQRAAELDSSFNLPLIWLIQAYRNLQKTEQRDSVYEVLKHRVDRLMPLDKAALDFFTARGDDERAYQALVTLTSLAPLSNWTHNRALLAHKLGRASEAASLFRQLDADRTWIKNWVFYWVYYSSVLHDAERFNEEMAVVRDGLRHSSDPWAFVMAFKSLGGRGDTASIDRLADSLELHAAAGPVRGSAGSRLRFAALEASVHGHARAARYLARKCVQALHAHEGQPDYVLTMPLSRSRFQASLADCHSLLGEWAEADAAASEAARFNDTYGDDAAIRAILISAHLGDSSAMRQRIETAYARPQFQHNSLRRHLTEALLAAMRDDARVTARELSQIRPPFGGFGRNVWHLWPEITPKIRVSREMRPLVRMP